MGGTNFSDIGRGKTVGAAFINAVKQAQYDHGHGGYSGTIAEKGDYVESPRPPRWTPEKIERLVWQAIQADNDDWAKAQGYKLKKYRGESDEAFKVRKARERKWAAEARRDRKKLFDLYGERPAREMMKVADEKWGPCVAIQKSANEWYFFGIASC